MSNGALVEELQDAELLQCAVCSSTLQDAVLLTCLHSVCRSCADATVSVTCPVCRVATDTSAAKANMIVSTLVHRSQVMKNMFSCTHCAAESQQDTSSVAWCYTCQLSLCVDCEKHHKRYNHNQNVKQIDEHAVLSELYRPPIRMCTKHGVELTLVCFTCQDGRCFKCAHDCYKASHDVELIDSPAAVDRLKDRVTDAARVISDLSSIELLLQAHLSLPEKVAGALEESRTVLRNAKKKAVDSISKAYDKAEQSLFECSGVLASKADALLESANSLKKRLDWANKYCRVALHTEDIVSLLPQLNALSCCLFSLQDEGRKVAPPVDPLKLISRNVYLPDDLDMITSDWIRPATAIGDKFDTSIDNIPNEVTKDYYARRVSALSELEELIRMHKELQESFERDRLAAEQQLDESKDEVRKLMDKQKELLEELARERRNVDRLQAEIKSKTQQLAAPTKPLSFDSKPQGMFKGPGSCFDVTVTPEGSLLVAAMADGLKEYEATSFREIATWKPDSDLLGHQKNFWVNTVDVLSDGRALVGLNPKLVVLLRRNVVGGSNAAAAWRVERRVADLHASPRRLSAWNDRLLVVLEDRLEESKNTWVPGPGLVLFSLCEDGDKQMHRQQLDYNACSVALTDRGVIVASCDQVEVVDPVGGGKRQCYVVDCYSHQGVWLWRHVCEDSEKVMSVCSDSVGRVIYAANCRGPVVALSGDDGRKLSTVITFSASDTISSYAIALEAVTQRHLVVILKENGEEPNNIKIFTVE